MDFWLKGDLWNHLFSFIGAACQLHIDLSLAHCRTVSVKRGDTADQRCWGFSVLSGEHLEGFLKNVKICVGLVKVLRISKILYTLLSYRHICIYVLEYAHA